MSGKTAKTLAGPAKKGSQRGGFAVGLITGLLIGLALSLAVALYITKAPVPFIDKLPQRSAAQDDAEAQRNRNWDPNGPLAGKRPGAAASGVVGVASAPAQPAPPAGPQLSSPGIAPGTQAPATAAAPAAAKASAAEPYVFVVQAGAYTRTEDAEQQRAKLALIGQIARITERESVGRTVYRVRLGPFETREEAEATQARLKEQQIEAQIVRVERP